MSKKKDRLNSEYRYCPICGRKTISIDRKNVFKKEYYIHCYECNEYIRVERKQKVWKIKN